ncbi:MAG: hypothetical protein EXS31_13655 [Pedosphaera sp.]|nr:hypothetical protein [Pedosphaera sp.]
MRNQLSLFLATTLTASACYCSGQQLVNGRKSLVFENPAARLVVDVSGGAIGDFRFKGEELNPLNWATPKPGDTAVRGFGHFLCLDRWGPPSDAEGSRGMPYHGEAANVEWQVLRDVTTREGLIESEMAAKLPMAGLSVRRKIRMSTTSPVFTVREEIKNENALGRIYNAVQHPTVGPPFLNESTLIDCNGRRGFAQGGTLPTPEEPSFFWPQALNQDGQSVNLRHLTGDPNPNVVSYAIEDAYGWVTAATPLSGLLIGYVWKTSDYPWVSLWRDVGDGKPAARGLEFGTTGLHQPFPILVKKGRIWDRQLFEHLDAGETTTKSYTTFLLKIPRDFAGVESIKVSANRLLVRERSGGKPREFTIETAGLSPN